MATQTANKTSTNAKKTYYETSTVENVQAGEAFCKAYNIPYKVRRSRRKAIQALPGWDGVPGGGGYYLDKLQPRKCDLRESFKVRMILSTSDYLYGTKYFDYPEAFRDKDDRTVITFTVKDDVLGHAEGPEKNVDKECAKAEGAVVEGENGVPQNLLNLMKGYTIRKLEQSLGKIGTTTFVVTKVE